MKIRFTILLLVLLSLTTSCLTTSAILRNKTIIKHKTYFMSYAGMNWGYPNKGREQFDLYNELGINWLRIDFSWDKLEKEKGTWDFSQMDYFCEEATTRGYKILGVLSFDTPWLHDDPENKKEIPLDKIDLFLNYVSVVIDRYGDYVDEWEIWNEPNEMLNTFWTGSNEDFFEFTRLVAAHIKSIDPTIQVMGGSHWRYDKSYIKEMYEWGALDNVDIFSYHPYYDKPEKIYDKSRDLEDYLKYLGFTGEFRVTEAGFNTYGRLPTSCKPEEQGRMVLETLVLLGSMKHPYLIWYSLYNGIDDKPTGLWSDQYGLLIKDGDKFEYKTGGWAFRRYNELIAGKYINRDRIIVQEELEKKVAATLYWDGVNTHSRTLVLLGEKKSQDINITGFDSATLYNCATGEIMTENNEIHINLLYNEPYIIVLNNITNILIQKK